MVQHRPGEEQGIREVDRLNDLKAQELASYLLSANQLEASIGMATLNALLDVPPQCFQDIPVPDLVLQRGQDQRVAVVGHFPFVDRLRGELAKLHVLELRPRQGDMPASLAQEILPRCQVVVVTATVLLNGTYREILPLCGEAFTVMVGPSAPPSPVLFQYGVDVLAGSLVVEPEETLRAVSQGATYRDLLGVRKWIWFQDRP
jgi:uncharacterized protein (DUF4213/DUF364 family)